MNDFIEAIGDLIEILNRDNPNPNNLNIQFYKDHTLEKGNAVIILHPDNYKEFMELMKKKNET